ALAQRFDIPAVHGDVAAALAAGGIDAVHVLAPPPLHAELALPFLRAGLPVLVEKPMAATAAECDALVEAGGARLWVNQNFLFHPAFLRLRHLAENRSLGGLVQVDCLYAMPLRQLAARRFGHWMFRQPLNLLLEQAVHPLSQIDALAGPARDVKAMAGAPRDLAPGLSFHPWLEVALDCAAAPARLHFAPGRPFPAWRLAALFEDGLAIADMLANRLTVQRRARWIEPLDTALSGASLGWQQARQAGAGLAGFAASSLGLAGRSDTFFQSMKGSIAAFHADTEANGALGARLVRLAEGIAAQAMAKPAPRPPRPAPSPDHDILVVGGTGFIGTHVVRALLAEGRRVAVLARNVEALPAEFERVTLIAGDATRREPVEAAIGANCRVVVDLAQGASRAVAAACRAREVALLVHVGSIAALWLGDPHSVVTGATETDPLAERRSDYARAKGRDEGLSFGSPSIVLRPGLVVGEGAQPFHSGLGTFNNEQHCLGWNQGDNPLPFVLVEDVAKAIALACRRPDLAGRRFNLVGDVRPTARAYVNELGRALGRPLRFHGQSPLKLWAVEEAKWLVKRIGGRKVPPPSLRDLRSRGLVARFDTTDVKRDLGWRPVADQTEFVRRAILVHRA
ncbi:MAG: NAD-dependent epimerase/dehydratase family protein, partial [Alphaproteobacteria bacterium]|nr:NAD-dependent epimerase/dehydratase family protein [Alphaproteobacteria bacterium]